MADAVEPLVMLCSRCYGAGFVDTGTCHHCGGAGSYSEEPNPAPQRLIRVEPVSVDLSDEMHPQLYVLHPDGSLSPATFLACGRMAMLDTVYVITWSYSDGSGSGAVAAFSDRERAEKLVEMLMRQDSIRRFDIEAVPFDFGAPGVEASGDQTLRDHTPSPSSLEGKG